MFFEARGDAVSLGPGMCQRACRDAGASDLYVATAPTCIEILSTRTTYPHIPTPRRCIYFAHRAHHKFPLNTWALTTPRLGTALPPSQKAISRSPRQSGSSCQYRLPFKTFGTTTPPRPTRNLIQIPRIRRPRMVAHRVSGRRGKRDACYL